MPQPGEASAQRVVMPEPTLLKCTPTGWMSCVGNAGAQPVGRGQGTCRLGPGSHSFQGPMDAERNGSRHRVALGRRVFEDERAMSFFASGSTVECEPEWMGEEGLMRPDRVVRNEEGWHVVDYKAGVNVDTHTNRCAVCGLWPRSSPPNLEGGSSTSTLCDLWRSFPTRHLVSSRQTDSPLLPAVRFRFMKHDFSFSTQVPRRLWPRHSPFSWQRSDSLKLRFAIKRFACACAHQQDVVGLARSSPQRPRARFGVEQRPCFD